ncbi:MAG: methylmalonyl Co-A mutase-associated GTPase MeaB [Sediminibacterium sp.]|nr:methylmalonyl Co-A mutase-associated GTPase MeaB [Sediminibacterium sp.]
MNRSLPASYYVEGILNKNVTILSRAITLVESQLARHRDLAQEIIQDLLPHCGASFRLGITGVPGVGKSTFIESYGRVVLEKGHRLAVLAIDPSSTRSKGSILGDKTRMSYLSAQANAYIRPSPSSGSLGGVARATHESILLCEAFGFDYIIVETVGVGQSETAVSDMTDFFLLLMLAGAGDELQGIKRGIMEMADGIAITKADGTNVQKAKAARAEYDGAIHLFPPSESGWIPEVKVCSSTEQTGITDLYDMIERYRQHSKANGYFEHKRREQQLDWMLFAAEEAIRERFYKHPEVEARLAYLKNTVQAASFNPFQEGQRLITLYNQSQTH